MADPHTTVLRFDPARNDLGEGKELRDGLSAVLQIGDTLWVANDETACVERLSARDGAEFGDHVQISLADYLDLPRADGDDVDEVDVEGLAHDGGYLWVVGSHSRRRSKPEDGREPEENVERLATVRRKGNRFLLARIPVDPDARTLAREIRRDGERRTAARLRGGPRGNALTKALAADEHLAPFLAMPGKDNGFNVEGIAVAGSRLFVGLRGPVLQGWAVVLELAVKEDAPWLRLRKIGPGGRPYRKHFVDLRGLGVRDLVIRGDDLLILAGPTMMLDGPVAVYRWRGGAASREESLAGADVVEHVLDVPYGRGDDRGRDHAEGITLFSTNGDAPDALLVVYDQPSKARRAVGKAAVAADVFPLR